MRAFALVGRADLYARLGKRRLLEQDLTAARKIIRTHRDAGSELLVEMGACQAYGHLGDWRTALRLCQKAAKQYVRGDEMQAMQAMLTANIAEAQLETGDSKTAHATLEALAKQDQAALGAPPSYHAELMFVLARARRAIGDEPGALAAADTAERELVAIGSEGRSTFRKLQTWRTAKPQPGVGAVDR